MTETAGAAPNEQAATLELRELTLRTAGGVTTSPLSLRSEARRIGLVGQWAPFFRALQGEAVVASGSARILGSELRAALGSNVVGFAPCDPPLPRSFSAREYLEQAARLGHGSRARAVTEARRTLEAFGLLELATQQLGALGTVQRRALGVALATLSAPAVVCLETPLRGLDTASAEYIARLCAHAAERCHVLVSAAMPRAPSAERTLLGDCEELFVLQRGALVAQGPPESVFAPGARYLLTLVGSNSAELVLSLEQARCQLTPQPVAVTFGALLTPGRAVTRYLVELPEPARPDLLLDAALANGVSVLELEPLFDD